MRAAMLALLLALPAVAAATAVDAHASYVVTPGGQYRWIGAGWAANGAAFWPRADLSSATIEARDVSGLQVAAGVCHEWTFNDGRHAEYECLPRACGSQTVALRQPADAEVVYRLLVFVFDAPHGCASRAFAGDVVARFA